MNHFRNGILGLAVGDALGVPYENFERAALAEQPVTGMTGYGAHRQPEGSWSDDTSMTLCAADSLCRGFDLHDMMKKFSAWKNRRRYTATGVVFDVGRTCRKAIDNFDLGLDPESCGTRGEMGNGNGALMRILPVSLWCILQPEAQSRTDEQLLAPVHASAEITHAHARGLICCGLYTLFLDEWLKRADDDRPADAAARAYARGLRTYQSMHGDFEKEISSGIFLHPDALAALPESSIGSGGYVMDSFNAAFWCLFNTDSYAECALRAVNLGGDTDTTAAIAGSLAGVVYGEESIPTPWLEALKNRELVERIADNLHACVCSETKAQEISAFTGEHAHMALKYTVETELDGLRYANAYAAWLAQRAQPENRDQFCFLNAHQARRLSKQLPVCPEWQEEESLHTVLKAKYTQNPVLAKKLLATGEQSIIYDTTGAHDNHLGRCACPKCTELPHENLLGLLLMRVRDELR